MRLVRAGEEGDRAWIFTELGELILARLNAEGCRTLARAKPIDPTPEGGPHPPRGPRKFFA
jgi:hypothetical protein